MKGIAKQIRQKLLTDAQFEHYKQLCKTWGGHALGTCYLDKVGDRKYVAHLFGENIPTLKRIDTNYSALQNACTELKLTAEQHNLPVAVPGYIGCGLAGGNSLRELLAAYNPLTGNLWVLVLAATLLSPAVVRKI